MRTPATREMGAARCPLGARSDCGEQGAAPPSVLGRVMQTKGQGAAGPAPPPGTNSIPLPGLRQEG